MVVFQNKIIYMPSMPPFSRGEKIVDYEEQCKPVEWREERIRSADGVEVALAVGCTPTSASNAQSKHVVIVYFQGNGSSLPPRLPGLSHVLKSLQASAAPQNSRQYTVVALSYRGFWTSKGRPSERGIALDAAAAIAWVSNSFPPDSVLVLWGQSIGAGVAVAAAATSRESEPSHEATSLDAKAEEVQRIEVRGLLLETPFTSVKDMLAAIYPQTWLPYRYLWPFLRSHWDSRKALSRIIGSKIRPQTLILQAGGDELVPYTHGVELEAMCKAGHMDVKRLIVNSALHHEAVTKSQGRVAVTAFLEKLGDQG